LGFWNISIEDAKRIENCNNENLIGYAILKLDHVPSKRNYRWHVFESVLKKYDHKHNCVPKTRTYPVAIAEKIFNVRGVMYCQQNALSKACAQVAIRALFDGLPDIGELSCSKINQLAGNPVRPCQGLTVPGIRNVLRSLNVEFTDIEYSVSGQNSAGVAARESLPYQKFVYSGIESGLGALLGFHLAGPGIDPSEAEISRHIIPFFGHTFNKDTWAPDAARDYFEIGSGVGYISSESWTSSFIGHDDNFGSDFCVPKLYVKPEQVDYVVEMLAPGCVYSGVQAEAMSLIFLYSLFPEISKSANPWMRRLAKWADPKVQRVVLRAISLSCEKYIAHLEILRDWEGNGENLKIINTLKGLKGNILPNMLWLIEVSIPHLFPANEHKVGEIILDAGVKPASLENNVDFNLFVMARLPETYYFLQKSTSLTNPNFLKIPSSIKSHVPLINI